MRKTDIGIGEGRMPGGPSSINRGVLTSAIRGSVGGATGKIAVS